MMIMMSRIFAAGNHARHGGAQLQLPWIRFLQRGYGIGKDVPLEAGKAVHLPPFSITMQ
jgi:hypothetical protein